MVYHPPPAPQPPLFAATPPIYEFPLPAPPFAVNLAPDGPKYESLPGFQLRVGLGPLKAGAAPPPPTDTGYVPGVTS